MAVHTGQVGGAARLSVAGAVVLALHLTLSSVHLALFSCEAWEAETFGLLSIFGLDHMTNSMLTIVGADVGFTEFSIIMWFTDTGGLVVNHFTYTLDTGYV